MVGTTVRDVLASMIGRSDVYYLPNPGNGGDALVNVGFFDLARSLGLRYRITNLRATLGSGDVLILGGGGSFVPDYSHAANAVRKFSPVVERFVILPQSIRGYESLLRELGDNTVIFAREMTSLEHCRSACGKAVAVYFDHDMAFYAKLDYLKHRKGFRGLQPTLDNAARLALIVALRASAHWDDHLRAFRTDRESAGATRASLWTDVSKLTGFGTRTQRQNYFASAQFVQTIDRFRTIETDRLHVAIAGAMLGKRTILHDNNYHKCQAVYEASLQRYDVQMRGSTAA